MLEKHRGRDLLYRYPIWDNLRFKIC
ncbi:hypothetical protein LINGRAHAP2_LOCUS21974 [Linum grandiflorum]